MHDIWNPIVIEQYKKVLLSMKKVETNTKNAILFLKHTKNIKGYPSHHPRQKRLTSFASNKWVFGVQQKTLRGRS